MVDTTMHGPGNGYHDQYEIASFDVFDTVLTRWVGLPKSVFLLLGRRLASQSLLHCTPEAFAHARTDAVKRVWNNLDEGEPTLCQIYTELGDALQLSEAIQERFLALELELENQVIAAIPGVKAVIDECRTKGQRIAYLSDTYFPGSFIQDLLIKHRLWSDDDQIYASCEYGASKSSGKLFQELLKNTGIKASMICHRGNHHVADIEVPRRLGIRVEPFLSANANRYEDTLEEFAYSTEGLSSVMAGASKLARLNVDAGTAKQRFIRDVSAGAIAPTFVGCVLWMLQRAKQLELSRLYFLSRDGQIFYELARRLAPKLNISCDLRYLLTSRESCYAASITKIDQELLHYVQRYKDRRTVRLMLAQVGVDPEEIREDLDKIGLLENRWSEELNTGEMQLLCNSIRDCKSIRHVILRNSTKKREVLVRYFKQEGLFDPINWGVVDIGWRGTIQNALGRVLVAEGHKLPAGLYFGLIDNSLYNLPDHREAYFFDERFKQGFVDLFPRQGLPRLIEMFSRAEHGTVVSYEDNGCQIRPILGESRNTALLDWGFPLMRQAIYLFVENLQLDTSLVNIDADVRRATSKVLQNFWLHPSKSEVLAFADYPNELGLGYENRSRDIVEIYGWKHVISALWTGKPVRSHPCIWDEGSLLLSGWHIRFALRAAGGISRRIRSHVIRLRQAMSVYSNRLFRNRT